jgi:putative transposase
VPKEEIQAGNNDSSHGLPVYPNLLKSTKITVLNQAWASDITYVQFQHEHVHLVVILDLYSRKCICWELSQEMGSQLAMSALDKALENRSTGSYNGLVHHSDRGMQYALKDCIDCLKKHNT